MRADGPSEESLQAAALRLASNETVENLRQMVERSRERVQSADQRAQDQPGPDTLRHFRQAALELAGAERALRLAEQRELEVVGSADALPRIADR